MIVGIVLNKLVGKLEKRRRRSDSQKVGRFTSKERILSSPSHLEPPENCPEWAMEL